VGGALASSFGFASSFTSSFAKNTVRPEPVEGHGQLIPVLRQAQLERLIK
jgi:hypothetical protein